MNTSYTHQFTTFIHLLPITDREHETCQRQVLASSPHQGVSMVTLVTMATEDEQMQNNCHASHNGQRAESVYVSISAGNSRRYVAP